MEDRKFLDLDHICDQIVSQEDRAMFDESIRCYQVGSHRAAIILAWCVTADCLYRRIDELANEGDGVAQKARQDLKSVQGSACYEENLIAQAKKCELFDDYEEKCLRFARDTRSKCAHPTGVIPSAEAVRNILHICSQTVLCRDGYRGMSFIKHFVQTKLPDKYLFSDKNRIKEACRYCFSKVPERIRPQFAVCSADYCSKGGVKQAWKSNALLFFKELMANSPTNIAKKIAQKFQPIEGVDQALFSIFAGIDPREEIWDIHTRDQAKAHLRETLNTGKVDPHAFNAYGNICSLADFASEDVDLIKERFSLFAGLIAQHSTFLRSRRTELLSLIIDGINENDQVRSQILKGLTKLISSELFMHETGDVVRIIDEIIGSDWREEPINELLLMCSDWTDVLKVSLLNKSERFFEECSDDFPDDIVLIFEAASTLIDSNSAVLPTIFEHSIKDILEGNKTPAWFEEEGATYHNFVGQIDLIKTQHGTHLAVLSVLDLPELNQKDLDSDE